MGLMNFLNGKTKEGKIKMVMVHYTGLPGFLKEGLCDMVLDTETEALIFKAKLNKKAPEITLPLSKITSAGNVIFTETKEQSKTGRAVAGGLLFGPAGAIVGALTAQEKEKLKSLYIINYKSDGEDKVITLKENGNLNYFKFQKQLQEYLPNATDETFDDNITI